MADIKIPLPKMILEQPPVFRFDKTRDRYMLIEHTPIEGSPALILDTFLCEGESNVVGHTMLRRGKEGAKERGAGAGQLHAERMIEQQDKIPVEWQDFYLVFIGTVWCGPDGDLCVPYLYYDDDGWHLDWRWLDYDWGLNDDDRLVRISK